MNGVNFSTLICWYHFLGKRNSCVNSFCVESAGLCSRIGFGLQKATIFPTVLCNKSLRDEMSSKMGLVVIEYFAIEDLGSWPG